MERAPLISVVVPVYKVERYLNQCIRSIVDQTYKNLEIILVEDGSPDHCSEICDQWGEKDSRIKVIHQPNGGGGKAQHNQIRSVRNNRNSLDCDFVQVFEKIIVYDIQVWRKHGRESRHGGYNQRYCVYQS